MGILYTILIHLYTLVIYLVSPFHFKASLWRKGRKNIFSVINNEICENDKLLWFHCASLGEFEQGRPVIEKIKKEYPNYKIVLTFFSPSGFEVRKNYQGADHVFYLPADTPGNAKKFIEILNPEKAFFIKYEFWYNYLKRLNNRQVPVYIVSAIFRENQLFFKKFGKWYRKFLYYINHFFVQDEKSESLLRNIGIKNVTISGDTRFDRVHVISKQAKELPLVNEFKNDNLVLIAGSSWAPDEEVLLSYLNKYKPPVKIIIAPHEIHNANITRVERLFSNYNCTRYSKLGNSPAQYDVLIIDNIGMLSSLYKYGDIAMIGGGFGKGIHNILEAATFYLPVLFGPNYTKFREAVDMVRLGGADCYKDVNSLAAHLEAMINKESLRKEKGEICGNYVTRNIGATDIIMQHTFHHTAN